MARLWAKTVTFESVRVDDQLPVVVKWETSESMKMLNAQVSPDDDEGGQEIGQRELSLHSDALVGYVTEMLEKAFPISSITSQGSSIQVEPSAPIRPEDIISLSGKVIAKREEDGCRLVECEIIVEGEDATIIARGVAVVSL
jgi:hypothetical protein